MKFSLAVTEFDPLHNGHRILIDRMKEEGGTVVIIMSGNFCQRGQPAVLDKYTRARHAVLAGADLVIELPTVFSTAPAEIFAKGAIKLLDSIKGEKTLFFGTEVGTKKDFSLLAEKLSTESDEFKAALKKNLSDGAPFALARADALKQTEKSVRTDILDNPNSVLGLEYVRAIKFFGSDMAFEPIKRNTSYLSGSLGGTVCSALAVREALAAGNKGRVSPFVPGFVYDDLTEDLPFADDIAIYKLLSVDKRELKSVVDCSEGLENRIKALAANAANLPELIDKLETRRYTRARLQRIITANMLGISQSFTQRCLKSNLYLKVLAVAADKKDLLSTVSGGKNRLLTRKSDVGKLSRTAKECFYKDAFACRAYDLITGGRRNEFEMKIVER